MGKGDRRTKRGKVHNHSYGARRPKKGLNVAAAAAATPAPPTAKKSPRKK